MKIAIKRLLEEKLFSYITNTCDELKQLATLKQAFRKQFTSEYQTKQITLKKLAREQKDFMAALDVASPSLLSSALLYLQQEGPSNSKHTRHTEVSLVNYLLRASVKTSPLSRCAWTCPISRLAYTSHERFSAAIYETSTRSVVQLNASTCGDLVRYIREHPVLGLHIPYVVNPDLSLTDTDVVMFRRFRVNEANGHKLQDQYVQLPLTSKLRSMIEILRSRGPLSPIALSQMLGENAVATLDHLPESLQALIRNQLLVPKVAIDDNTVDPLKYLLNTLKNIPSDSARELIPILSHIRTLLGRYSSLQAAERLEVRHTISEILQRLFNQALVPGSKKLPTRLIYENATAELRAFTPPKGLVEAPQQDLEALAKLIAILDNNREWQLRLVKEFVRAFGVGGICDEPLSFLLHKQYSRKDDSETVTYLTLIDQHMLNARTARQELIASMYEQCRMGKLVQLDKAWISQLAARYGIEPYMQSMTLLLQAINESGQIVLNSVLPGYGALFARQAFGFAEHPSGREVISRVKSNLRRLHRPAYTAQFIFNSENSINHFPIMTDNVIKAPGTTVELDTETTLRLNDFQIRHDPEQHRLEILDKAGTSYIPLYTGTLVYTFLPPTDRVLLLLAPAVWTRSISVDAFERYRTEFEPDDVSIPRVYPRICLGKFVILRKSWFIPAGQKLQRERDEGDFAYWSRIKSWAERHQLPRIFYIYPDNAWNRYLNGLDIDVPKEPRAKPLFIDLDNYFCLRLFEKWCRNVSGDWRIQEALPTPEQASVEFNGQQHAAELCIELQREEIN